MVVKNNVFYVVDANHNRVLRVTPSGDISITAQFADHPVPTGITFRASGGPFYVSSLGVFPFLDDDGNVYSASTSGNIAETADGMGSLIDVEVGPGDNLYALSFATQNPSGDPAPWNFFSGRIGKVNADGSITPVVEGLSFPGGMLFVGDTAYITNNGLSALAPGEIVKIVNFSQQSVAAATATPATQPTTAPVATATRPVGITAPDTGSGGYGDSDGTPIVAILVLLAAVVALGTGGTVAARRGGK